MARVLTEHALALDDFLTATPGEGQEALHAALTESAYSMKTDISALLDGLSGGGMDADVRADYIRLEVTAMQQCIPLYYNVAVSAAKGLL